MTLSEFTAIIYRISGALFFVVAVFYMWGNWPD